MSEAFAVRLYRWLLRRVLPTSVAARHGEEMVATFERLHARAGARAGAMGRLVATYRDCLDLLRFAWRERRASNRGARPFRAGRRSPGRRSSEAGALPSRWLDDLGRDLRLGLRGFVRAPLASAVIVATLALGIGANTAMFSVFDALLLDRLPVPDIDRVVAGMGRYEEDPFAASGLDYLAWREQADTLASVGAARSLDRQLGPEQEPRRVSAAEATPDYFATLAVEPVAGRLFDTADDMAVVLLGHELWRAGYGGDPDVVGSEILLDGTAHEIVGVLPPGFDLPQRTDLWTPLSFEGLDQAARQGRDFFLVGRMADGVAPEAVWSELETVGAGLAESSPDSHRGWSTLLMPLRQQILGDVDGTLRASLLALLGAVALLLLITCVNVSNLLLARAIRRRQEIAVRVALGAGRARLFRQLAAEGLLTAFVGGAVGLLAAVWALPLLLASSPVDTLALGDTLLRAELDLRILGFTLAVCLTTGLLLAVAPSVRVSRTDPQAVLSAEARGSTGSATRLMGALVVVEIALTVALLVGAGLLGRSFLQLRSLDPGFAPEGLLVARVMLPLAEYAEEGERARIVEELADGIGRVREVEQAGVTTNIPLDAESWDAAYEVVDGRPRDSGEIVLIADRRVAGDYMEALGVRLVRGRLLSSRDRADTAPVAVVTADLAQREWPGQDPIGQRIRRRSTSAETPWRTIVGVVEPVKEDAAAYRRDRAAWYVPYAQDPGLRNLAIVVRAAGDPLLAAPAVREAVARIDARIPVTAVTTMSGWMRQFHGHDRFRTTLVAAFSGLALLLAALGIYGLIAQAVADQRREIGLQLALGAETGRVLRGVVMRGLKLGALGTLPGIVAGALLGRALSGITFRVFWADPLVLGGAAAACLTITLVAVWLPARRATRIDPAVALRSDE